MDFHGLMRRGWRTTYSDLQYRGGYALALSSKTFCSQAQMHWATSQLSCWTHEHFNARVERRPIAFPPCHRRVAATVSTATVRALVSDPIILRS